MIRVPLIHNGLSDLSDVFLGITVVDQYPCSTFHLLVCGSLGVAVEEGSSNVGTDGGVQVPVGALTKTVKTHTCIGLFHIYAGVYVTVFDGEEDVQEMTESFAAEFRGKTESRHLLKALSEGLQFLFILH